MASGLMEHTFDPSICERDRWISISLRQVLRHPGLFRPCLNREIFVSVFRNIPAPLYLQSAHNVPDLSPDHNSGTLAPQEYKIA